MASNNLGLAYSKLRELNIEFTDSQHGKVTDVLADLAIQQYQKGLDDAYEIFQNYK
tara:strand:- start:2692 stop:2859 length:168 start_codon:yes stop_codon:yes gene_type:complete